MSSIGRGTRGLGYLSIYRVILVLLGVVSYFAVTRIIFRAAVALSPHDMTLLLLIPYLAAGVAACVAALFYQPDRSGAVLGAFRESFLTNIPLLAIVLRPRARIEASAAPEPIARSYSWLIGATVAYVLFVLVLGRGISAM